MERDKVNQKDLIYKYSLININLRECNSVESNLLVVIPEKSRV